MSAFNPAACRCTHPEDSHYLVRCGCPNDREPKHPMHQMDDAFHRIWCSECLSFCFQPPKCPNVLAAARLGYSPAPEQGAMLRLKETIFSFLTFFVSSLRWARWSIFLGRRWL